MEDNKNSSQSQVQSLAPEQIPPATPLAHERPKRKLKLQILIAGIVILLLLIGGASATFIFLSKSSSGKQKQTKVVITPQPTFSQTTIIPSPTGTMTTLSPVLTPTPTISWATYTYVDPVSMFTLKYPNDKWIVQDSSERGLDGGGTVLFAIGKELVFVNGSKCLGGKTYEEANAYQGETLNVGVTIKLLSKKSLSLEGMRGFLIETEEVPSNKFISEVCLFNSEGKPKMGFRYVGFDKDGYDKYKQNFAEIIPTYKMLH